GLLPAAVRPDNGRGPEHRLRLRHATDRAAAQSTADRRWRPSDRPSSRCRKTEPGPPAPARLRRRRSTGAAGRGHRSIARNDQAPRLGRSEIWQPAAWLRPTRDGTTTDPRKAISRPISPRLLHLPEKMEKLAGNRQPLGPPLEQEELFFRILAEHARHRADVDDCTAMHLPEAFQIEVGEQFLQRRCESAPPTRRGPRACTWRPIGSRARRTRRSTSPGVRRWTCGYVNGDAR